MLEDGESRLLYGKILRISSLFNAMLEIKVQEPLNCIYVWRLGHPYAYTIIVAQL